MHIDPNKQAVIFDDVDDKSVKVCVVRKVCGVTPKDALDIAFCRLSREGFSMNIKETNEYGNFMYHGFGRIYEDEKQKNDYWLVKSDKPDNCYVFAGRKN